MSTERDTHFAGYTELLYPDLARLFAAMHSYMATGEEDKAKMVETVIKDVLTCRAYDLACYVFYETSYGLDRFYIPERINENVPDLREWPK